MVDILSGGRLILGVGSGYLKHEFEGFRINAAEKRERFRSEYGAVPDPSVFLASLAQRTRRLRLGTSISVLTFRNPLTVAETYTMVDILSGGRLILGVGSGYLKHEFEGFRINPAEKRERF